MKELLFKSLICLLVIIISVNVFTSITYATADTTATTATTATNSTNFDLTAYETAADDSIKKPFESVIGAILGVIRIVGTAVALIIIMVIAIKYMSAAPGDRADIKKSSIQYVVGALIIFGSTNIITILVEVFTQVFTSTSTP